MSEGLLRVRCVPAPGVSADVIDLPLPDEKTPAAGVLLKAEPGTLIWRTRLPDRTDTVVKLYRHRSVLQASRLRIDSPRAQREFEALSILSRRGVSCTEPLFWARGESRDHGRFELIATRALNGAEPLDVWLQSAAAESRHEVLCTAYRRVRAMHASGVWHGGLSFKNLLVSPGDRAVHLVDFNRSVSFRSDVVGTRMAWFDLADLTTKVVQRFGREAAAAPLTAYGLAPRDAERVLRFAERHRSTRRLRRGLRFEFQVRARLATLLRDPRAFALGWMLPELLGTQLR
jgi:tRNA A-37 threonylcarbamoyl transferase component Bud32